MKRKLIIIYCSWVFIFFIALILGDAGIKYFDEKMYIEIEASLYLYIQLIKLFVGAVSGVGIALLARVGFQNLDKEIIFYELVIVGIPIILTLILEAANSYIRYNGIMETSRVVFNFTNIRLLVLGYLVSAAIIKNKIVNK